MDVFDVINTQRAIRSFRPDPVPDELIHRVLDAAIRAPSGGNLQPWTFLVLRDPAVRERVSDLYSRAAVLYSERMAAQDQGGGPPARSASASYTSGVSQAPVLILACIHHSGSRGSLVHGGHIYPAVQTMMLAARALGLGTVMTTLYRVLEREIKEMLGIPENVDTAALIPLGYPAEGTRFGPKTRKPVEDVTYVDRWGGDPVRA